MSVGGPELLILFGIALLMVVPLVLGIFVAVDASRYPDWAFERAAGRVPVAEERNALRKLYASNLAQFQRSPVDARALTHEGEAPVANLPAAELAAMTTVARAILNMHETITRN